MEEMVEVGDSSTTEITEVRSYPQSIYYLSAIFYSNWVGFLLTF